MKKLTILILVAACMLSSECLETMVGTKYGLPMRNDSERNISVYGTYIQWDTVLPYNRPKCTIVHRSSFTPEHPYSHIMLDTHDWVSSLSDKDTVRIFIFDYEYLENNEWSAVREAYSILRYDITVKNLQDLSYHISYPPSPEMKHIKMWPPYEEVIKQQEMDKTE